MSAADDARKWAARAATPEPLSVEEARERAREELGREPSVEEVFMAAAGRPAAEARRTPPEPGPRPDDPLPRESPEDVFARLAQARAEG